MERDFEINEYSVAPKELATPPETKPSMEAGKTFEPREDLNKEFDGRSGKAEKEDSSRHLLKKLVVMPIASVIAAVTIVFASYGEDPLGEDFLGRDAGEYAEAEDQEREHDGDRQGGGGKHGDPIIVREYPGDLEGAHVHVTYVPTGEKFEAGETGEEGLEEAREWVRHQGGDPATLTYVDSEETFTGHYDVSDDAIIVGDLVDDPAHAYVAQGTVTRIMRLDVYYEAYETGREIIYEWEQGRDGDNEDYFPQLTNLDPDFDGNYAWENYGSEEFITVEPYGDNETRFLVAGDYWKNERHFQEVEVPGVTYDRETNTLTLRNFEAKSLETNLMGNGFTIELIGNSYVDQVVIYGANYGGSVKFTGSGSLVINDHWTVDGIGLWLYAESSESCLMVDKGVTLEVYGNPAFYVTETTMGKVIYLGEGVEMSGGTEAADDWETGMEGNTVHDVSVVDGDGNLCGYVHFSTVE